MSLPVIPAILRTGRRSLGRLAKPLSVVPDLPPTISATAVAGRCATPRPTPAHNSLIHNDFDDFMRGKNEWPSSLNFSPEMSNPQGLETDPALSPYHALDREHFTVSSF